MNIKTIILIALLVSMMPLSSSALWGRKKKKQPPKPENAWSILLADDQSQVETEVQVAQTTEQQSDQHKTVPQQFDIACALRAGADKARTENDFVSAIELYDKAIKEYSKLQNKYPDWQPAVIKFSKNHCTYHLKELLKQADKGEIKLDTSRPDKHKKPTKQEKASSLIKAKQLLMQNKNKKARDVLIKALMDDPDNRRIRLMIGIVQCRLKQYHDAIFLLETLIDEFPSDANARVILATAYFGLDRDQDAIIQLNKALKINPFHKEANFNMAKILLKTTPDDAESIAKYYIKAVELGADRDAKLNAAILK